MSTRNTTLVIDREHAEKSALGFADNPEEFIDNSYVNMYLHHDGYPAWQGVQLANWVKHWQDNPKTSDYHMMSFIDGSKTAGRLVHDHYYDSCYLYPCRKPNPIDSAYTYVVWTGKEEVWISCWDNYSSRCVFVLTPDGVIKKYKEDMEYTDWSKEIRYKQVRDEDYKLNTKTNG